MKVFLKELAVSLGYPALFAAALSFALPMTGQPQPDGSPVVSGFWAYALPALVVLCLIGVVVYAVWDWDRDPEYPFWARLLQVVGRIAATVIFFYPFLYLFLMTIGFLTNL